ncbi:Hypothetical_protein [Hexamita inflata]|uniref:Hypothetical_protein n=1 Tax=Hexamita inflata TaxID=28002 RepID=A0AA86NZ83_9EUKA|nr:Hypothetical protein HINF_LOCUS15161 [Hexamita inflata]
MKKQKQQRYKLSKDEQYMVDKKIINEVRRHMNVQKFETQEAQLFSSNKISMKVIWTNIDKKLKKDKIGKSYSSKSYAYNRFIDVILPNKLPPYPNETVVQIEKYIQEQVSSTPDLHDIWRSQGGVNDLVKKISKQTKEKFNLQGSDIYSYKKLVDSFNNYIKKCIKDSCNSPSNITSGDLIVYHALVDKYVIEQQIIENSSSYQKQDETQNSNIVNYKHKDETNISQLNKEEIQQQILPDLLYCFNYELSYLFE